MHLMFELGSETSQKLKEEGTSHEICAVQGMAVQSTIAIKPTRTQHPF